MKNEIANSKFGRGTNSEFKFEIPNGEGNLKWKMKLEISSAK